MRILLFAAAVLTIAACNSTDRSALTGTLQEINRALQPIAVFKVATP